MNSDKYALDMDYVRSVFEQSGLSYKSIAQTQGIDPTTVYRFFKGQKSPDFNTACSIIGAIGASLDRACGIVKPTDDTLTPELSPDPAAVVYEAVLQSIPNLADHVAEAIKDTVVDEQKIADQVADNIKDNVVDGQKVAEKVAEAIKDSPIDPQEIARAVLAALPPYPQPLSAAQIAKAVVDALPAAPAKDCDSCRTALAYETIIAAQTRILNILGGLFVGSVVLLIAFLLFLLFRK